MFEIKKVSISDIAVPERIRPVDEGHAQAIAFSIAKNGLINPITIRATPNMADGKYTLVAGAHRLRACIINGTDTTIEAAIIKADQNAAKMLEVSENLFRNELSVIDRAAFVQALRDMYEQENGKIVRGGDQKSKGKVYPLIEGQHFTDYVADRLGLSKEAIKLLNRISQNLNSVLRDQVRNSPLADNQTALLKFAKMEQVDQQRTAIALKEAKGDLKKALSFVGSVTANSSMSEPKDPQAGYLSKAIEAVSKMTSETFAEFEAYLADQKEGEAA